MRPIRLIAACLAGLVLAAGLHAQQNAPKRKKLLAIAQMKGFQHDSTSHGLAVIERLGRETGLWDTMIRTDTQLLTKQKLGSNAKNLDYFDAVLFLNTTGDLDLNDQQKAELLAFVREEGKGFLGAHAAADAFYKWPEYGELIGGYFDQHPWNTFDAPVVVEDRAHPLVKHFEPAFVINDEIYQFKDYSRDRVRVLMSLDAAKIDLKNPRVHRTDKDFAVTWLRNYGKGRVFYTTLGHTDSAWDRKDVQTMWVEAVKWAMGMTQADATPRPKS